MSRAKKWYAFAAIIAATILLWQLPWVKDSMAPLKIGAIDLIHIPENQLRFKVTVSTSRKSDAYLKYWRAGSRDTLYSDVSQNTATHMLWIVNATGQTDYAFQVVVKTETQKAVSKTYPLTSKSIYQAIPNFTLEQLDSTLAPELENRYFLTQILSEPGSAVILNGKGEIVWYESFEKGVKVSHWTPEKTVLCIVGSEKILSSGGDEIVEVDLNGKVVTHLRAGQGDMDKLVHHEVRTDSDGNIYALTFDQKVFDLTAVGGRQQDTVKADGIVIFSRSGKKLWEWSVLDHLDPLSDPHIMKNKKDWVHANSVFRDEDGNFLMSFRDLNQVWKIDFKTGQVVWKLGENGDFPLTGEQLFSAQHFAHITQQGELMMLDNGTRAGISRTVSFKLDPLQKTVEKTLDIRLPAEFYSAAKGNATLFNDHNVLFSLTGPRAFLMTDLEGNIRWKIRIGGDPYRLEYAEGFASTKPDF